MGQYDDIVERQRILLEAEEWAKQPRSVQVHRLTSMWYETEESMKDFENGKLGVPIDLVTDGRFLSDSTINIDDRRNAQTNINLHFQ